MPLLQSESKCGTILIKNDFDLHEKEAAYRTNFHMKGSTLTFVLRTRKWPICFMVSLCVQADKLLRKQHRNTAVYLPPGVGVGWGG